MAVSRAAEHLAGRAAGQPKLHDVARRAGVSLATASRALNGLASVDESLRRRVLVAAGEVG